jgi:hypothetical protein
VTDWFKLRDQHPTIDLPHAFASGPHVVSSWMQVGGRWAEIQHQNEDGIVNHRDAWLLDGGEAVLYDDGRDLWIYRRDHDPGMRTKVPCPTYRVSVSLDGTRISCVQRRFPGPNESRGWGSDTTVLRSDASTVAHYTSDLPGQLDGSGPMFIYPVGFLRDGTPLVGAEYPIPNVDFDEHCLLVAMDSNGGRVLSDVPRMRHCENPSSWRSQLPAGVEITLQQPTRSPHDRVSVCDPIGNRTQSMNGNPTSSGTSPSRSSAIHRSRIVP